jgi:hypothetical protein
MINTLTQPNDAAVTALVNDAPLLGGATVTALNGPGGPPRTWLLSKTSTALFGPDVIATLSGLGRWMAVPTSTASAAFPNRYDLSVNHARVESAASSSPVMVTGTTLNTAGAYTGGGTGNKAILGFKGHSGMLLSALASLSWEYDIVSPIETVPAPLLVHPYVNLVLRLDATPNYKILVIDPNQSIIPPPLNLGTLTPTGPTSWIFTHIPAADTNFVQVVNAFTPQVAAGIVPAMPIVSPPVPIAAGFGPIWNNASFRYSDILAAFPAAVLIDVYTGDGGLPGPAGTNTMTPSMFLCIGDSGFRRQRYIRMGPILLNGSPA